MPFGKSPIPIEMCMLFESTTTHQTRGCIVSSRPQDWFTVPRSLAAVAVRWRCIQGAKVTWIWTRKHIDRPKPTRNLLTWCLVCHTRLNVLIQQLYYCIIWFYIDRPTLLLLSRLRLCLPISRSISIKSRFINTTVIRFNSSKKTVTRNLFTAA